MEKLPLLRNDQNDKSQDVIEKTPLGKILIKSKKVDLIQPGEFVLFQGEEQEQTMLRKRNYQKIMRTLLNYMQIEKIGNLD